MPMKSPGVTRPRMCSCSTAVYRVSGFVNSSMHARRLARGCESSPTSTTSCRVQVAKAESRSATSTSTICSAASRSCSTARPLERVAWRPGRCWSPARAAASAPKSAARCSRSSPRGWSWSSGPRTTCSTSTASCEPWAVRPRSFPCIADVTDERAHAAAVRAVPARGACSTPPRTSTCR